MRIAIRWKGLLKRSSVGSYMCIIKKMASYSIVSNNTLIIASLFSIAKCMNIEFVYKCFFWFPKRVCVQTIAS